MSIFWIKKNRENVKEYFGLEIFALEAKPFLLKKKWINIILKMKKSLMTLGVLALFVLMAYGQEKKFALYSVAFYNMENLFDTIHDEGKNDYEYLPNGTNQWNTMKYKAKLKNMSEILSMLSTDKLPMGPAIIGVSEIENYRVLEDILKQPALADRGYQLSLIHI